MIGRAVRASGRVIREPHVREAAWIVAGQTGKILGALVSLKLLTGLLPKETFGQINLIMVSTVLAGWVLFEPFRQATIRLYAAEKQSGDLPALLRTSVTVHLVGSLLMVWLTAIVVYSDLPSALSVPPMAIVAATTIFLVEIWQSLGLGVADAARDRVRSARVSSFAALARPLIAAGLVIRFGPYAAVVMFGYAAAVSLTLIPALKPIVAECRGRSGGWFHADFFDWMLKYGAPFGMWSVLQWGQNYADRYALSFAAGSAIVGPYAAAAQIAAFPFWLGFTLIRQFIVPIAFEQAGGANDAERTHAAERLVRLSAVAGALCGGVVLALFAVAGPSLMHLLTHADYVVSRSVLLTLAVGGLALHTGQLLSTSLMLRNRSMTIVWAYAIPGAVSVPLSWALVGSFGILGAAVANAATSVMFLLMTVVLIRHARRVAAAPQPWGGDPIWGREAAAPAGPGLPG